MKEQELVLPVGARPLYLTLISKQEDSNTVNGQGRSETGAEEESAQVLPIKVIEKDYYGWALRKLKGDRRQVAKALGVSLKTVYNKIKEYGLSADEQ